MTSNTGDNYDPALPYGVDLEDIGLEPKPNEDEQD